ncbi:MAG: YraN family protein [Acidothermus sp.]|nr:YraN family protein [Acidothermus sp.]
MDNTPRGLGVFGEDLAVRYLTGRGIRVLARNWRCREGEVDIFARDGDVLVVCEVKTRRSTAFGAPVEAVTASKIARLRRLAIRWLAEQEPQQHFAAIRFDVVSVFQPPQGPPFIEYLAGVC